ncbi:acetamidase/formamidase family protein [Halomarina ordinaria]|uniref:Acetamidase/formamidase family protein n=1 Tax=Halomarina ordinaria TaxID=3033939 RepID=A0ABD5U689_9EURY|nr:acetamidase/formamidase family protein [Halomarina sp. PSRA2]
MASHELTEADQGEYHYTVGPYPDPVLHIESGDTVTVETHDAFEGAIETEDDAPSEVLGDYLNPQNGPIYVEGATPGDALAVTIEDIVPRGDQPRGTTCMIAEFGGLTGTDRTALLNDPLPEVVKKLDVTTDGVRWDDERVIPYEPFVGTISTAPELNSVDALTPDDHGGNMDLPDVCPGNTVYLPVNTEGAYLYLGDCHANQGDGELCGVAIEHPTETTITVDVVEDWDLSWPRVESDEFVMSVGSARPMEDAARIAYRDLVDWLVEDYGFETWDAYLFLTQVGSVRLGNMVDPNYTIGASVSKEYL